MTLVEKSLEGEIVLEIGSIRAVIFRLVVFGFVLLGRACVGCGY